uniref:30S ribosomal protein 3, chloroplastic n=1 Tax=Entransia fimbriata TaxID=130991 RepID=A0A191T4V9_9VIRI|nr:hypothetical chloroplast RF65 [Entransia fimbriata]YP_009256734.1 hypothetical chloroplast RF65 [Entransia fimbriata]ANI25425.1 hypothetical chloroplast RF65 [Entransia fimbriata]ANI25437.1 hypothetical chloroplast RF65 [Entransia fimbriata]
MFEKCGSIHLKSVTKIRFTSNPLYLRFVWFEKNIGIAIDQSIRNKGTLALTKYYFWPRQDAWEQLQTELHGRPWMKRAKIILLLNEATGLIHCWQGWQIKQLPESPRKGKIQLNRIYRRESTHQ